MNKLKQALHANPARVAAIVSSTVAILMSAFVPDMPVEPVIIFVMSAVGLGEYAQRVENAKTDEALFTDPFEVIE